MKKRILALLMILCLIVTSGISTFAEEDTDYSYLEDMSVKELRALRDAINEILGDGSTSNISNANKNVVEGRYYSIDNNLEYIDFTPDNSEKTMGSCKEFDSYLGSYIGEYRIVSDLITVKLSYLGTALPENTYQITDNYLIPHEYDYEGIIPDTDVFEATLTYPEFSKDVYTFREDLTYEHQWNQYDPEIHDYNPEKIIKSTGYYLRDGDILTLIDDNGDTIKFLINNGIANRSVYIKESIDE